MHKIVGRILFINPTIRKINCELIFVILRNILSFAYSFHIIKFFEKSGNITTVSYFYMFIKIYLNLKKIRKMKERKYESKVWEKIKF